MMRTVLLSGVLGAAALIAPAYAEPVYGDRCTLDVGTPTGNMYPMTIDMGPWVVPDASSVRLFCYVSLNNLTHDAGDLTIDATTLGPVAPTVTSFANRFTDPGDKHYLCWSVYWTPVTGGGTQSISGPCVVAAQF